MISIEKIRTSIKDLFVSDENVALAFVFGSIATGKMHPDSDIDVAVLLSSCRDRHKCAEISLSLSEQLAKMLGTDKVDLVILNTANPLLMFEVATKGVLVYERQAGLADDFKLKAVKMRMDAKKFFQLDKLAIKKFLSEMKPGA
ncbi:MAG: nucleotidyltransferase domain-containing protein [Candidatus Aquicultor sp.]|nr:nucleotidyltransferase domain-containing protein [Candidatus Aquicultor sp.]